VGVSIALRLSRTRSDAERWSFVTLVLAVAGLALAIWFVIGSQSDTSEVRWWLVVAPLFITAAPVLIPRQGVRVAAFVALAGWCFLALFSIGMLLVPALLAALAAAVKGG
jgi:hypothetical protein